METLEATVKIRDGKKWKKRFCVLHCSTANSGASADFALLEIYKDSKPVRKPGQKKRVLRIEGFYGLECGFSLDKESRTLAVLSQSSTPVLAFDSDILLRNWELWFRNAFSRGCQYLVYVADTPSSVVEIRYANARLHLRDDRFCLAVDNPPRVAVGLTFREIRRYGAFENKFCVEAGSRTGALAGVYIFRTGHRDQLSYMFRLASEGNLHRHLSADSGVWTDIAVPSGIVEHQSSSYLGLPPSSESLSPSAVYNDRRPLLPSSGSRGRITPASAAYSNGVFDGNDSLGSRGNVNARSGSGTWTDAGEIGTTNARSAGSNATLAKAESFSRSPMKEQQDYYYSTCSLRQRNVSKASSRSAYRDHNHFGAASYINQNLVSSDFYYNVSTTSTSDANFENRSNDAEQMPNAHSYLAMRPGGSVYERMDHSSAIAEHVHSGHLDENGSVSDGIFVKGFEPLILKKEKSRTLPLSHSFQKADRKLSLPASFAPMRQRTDGWCHRRLSLEEEHYFRSSASYSSVGGDVRVKTYFKSTKGLAKNLLRGGSVKATSILVKSLKKFSTTSRSDGGAGNDDGRHSRAYSEPPGRTQSEIYPRLSPSPFEGTYLGLATSSLDLDEVVYDVSMRESASRLPPSVLKKIGIKPLVSSGARETSASSVKLPLVPKQSFGTESTQSSDSMNAPMFDRFPYDQSLFDSVSVGSDDSYSDREPRKDPARYVTEGGTSRVAPDAQNSSAITLKTRKMSMNARRRLHDELTRPLTGSYSRYDGDGSGEPPMLSPSVVMSPARTAISHDYSKPPSNNEKRNQNRNYCSVQSNDILLRQSPASSVRSPRAPSPSPPAARAPSPPREESMTAQFRRLKLPHSALPRLEGQIFKFPPPQVLNYALLAGRDNLSPGMRSESGSFHSAKSSSSLSKSKEEGSVEYARIDQTATQAARKVATSRQDDARNRWASSQVLSAETELPQQRRVRQPSASSKCRRPFSLKRSFIRRRSSMTSLSGL